MNHIRSVLENLRQTPDDAYNRGILNGVLTTIMQERRLLFDEGVAVVRGLLDEMGIRPTAAQVPAAWHDAFNIVTGPHIVSRYE